MEKTTDGKQHKKTNSYYGLAIPKPSLKNPKGPKINKDKKTNIYYGLAIPKPSLKNPRGPKINKEVWPSILQGVLVV
jgi:hypothetical protein